MTGTYKERLEVEYADLSDKIDKLQAFLGTNIFAELDDLNRSLLVSQLSVMFSYQSILIMRIGGVPETVEL